VISAASYGTLALFARIAYAAGANPITLIFVRFSVASAVVGAALRVRRRRFPQGRVLLTLVLMGAVGYVCQALAYLTALTLIPASLVALLLYLYPGMVTLLSAALFRDRLTRTKVIALIAALTGMVLTVGPAGGGHPLGLILAVAAAGIYSVYIVVGSRVTPRAGALTSSGVIMCSAAIASGVLAAIHGPAFPQTALGWAALLAIAVVATVIPMVTFFMGMAYVGPSTAATLSTVEPIVTVLLATIFLHESLQPQQLFGGMLILAAVVTLARIAPA